MTGFSTFGLSEAVLNKLNSINFTTPTPIQEQAIPLAMLGRDILGTAQTGTGKTAAFGLPLVHHLLNNPHSCALIMTPTRELAVQVMTQIKSFLPDNNVKIALLIGGEPMMKQLTQLKGRPRIIVGTPGRINDHLERDTLQLKKTDFLVLDEADRMLDMGFDVQLEAIAKYLPEKRQTLMFSATVPPNIMKLAKNYLTDPARVESGSPHLAAPKIKQELIHVNDDAKHDELVKLLDARSGQVIVFVKTKHGADRLARRLHRENHSADAIHGDLRQGQRDRVIRTFRKNEVRILVATDVAARGLDIPMLETVINYDLPQNPEDYIHRIGRTGRNGQEGEAICLISGGDRSKWSAIDRLMNPGKARDKSERSEGGRGNGNRGPKKFGSGGKSFGTKSFGSKGFGPKKFGEKKFGEQKFADKPVRKFEERSERPQRAEWAPEKADRQDRPQRTERPATRSDRPARPEGAERSERPARRDGGAPSFGFKKPSGEKKFGAPSGDRPAKKWSSDKPAAKKEGGDWKGSFAKKDGPREGSPRQGGERREGGYKKSGGFNQGGPRTGGKSFGSNSGFKKPRKTA